MRFPNQATLEDLATLVAACDDRAGNHLIWIHHDGEVHVTHVEAEGLDYPDRTRLLQSGVAYLFQILPWGGNLVGPKAAADLDWMADLHEHLFTGWTRYVKACSERQFFASRIKGAHELITFLWSLEQP